jgi:tRNA A-37 threonylcarbamoyl transferase component Bud32
MRAFGMKARVADATQKVIYIEDAVQLLSHERGIDVSTPDTYARWFAKTLGSNIGKVHALGYIHGHMTAQNVTLDCRLVDLDSVEPTADLNEQVRTSIVETDVADGQEALGSLLKTLMHYFPQQISPLTQDELFRIYKDSYEEVQRS